MKKVINWDCIIGALLVGPVRHRWMSSGECTGVSPGQGRGLRIFLANSARERWMLMVQDDGMGNAFMPTKSVLCCNLMA